MNTILVRMSIDSARRDEVVLHLQNDVAKWATEQPGFVSGQWLVTADSTRGMGIVVFESADLANMASKGPLSYPQDDTRAWNIEGVDVFDQVAAEQRT